MTKKRKQDLLKIFIFIQLIIVIFMEGIRIIQEFKIEETKPMLLISSAMFTYLMKSIFEEYKKLKNTTPKDLE